MPWHRSHSDNSIPASLPEYYKQDKSSARRIGQADMISHNKVSLIVDVAIANLHESVHSCLDIICIQTTTHHHPSSMPIIKPERTISEKGWSSKFDLVSSRLVWVLNAVFAKLDETSCSCQDTICIHPTTHRHRHLYSTMTTSHNWSSTIEKTNVFEAVVYMPIRNNLKYVQ